MNSKLKTLYIDVCKRLNICPQFNNSGSSYNEYNDYRLWYDKGADERFTILAPRTYKHLIDITQMDINEISISNKADEIVSFVTKHEAKRLKDKLKREENRPIDELSIIAKALDEAKIPYTRHGTELRFDFVFAIKIIFDKEEKEMRLHFGKGDYYWENKIEGNLQDPNSKLLDNIIKIIQHSADLDEIANEITTD